MKTRVCIWMILLIVGPIGSRQGFSAGEHPFEKLRRDPVQLQVFTDVLGAVAAQAYGVAAPIPTELPKIFERPLPLFITLKKAGRVYGCMGTLLPKGKNLLEEIQLVFPKALFQDPRHPPVAASQLPGMEVYLSSVGKPQRVQHVGGLNPARDGVLVKSGNKIGVVLPGEAKTLKYLLAFAKSKAGIKVGESYQVFRLPTQTVQVTLHEKL